MTTNFPKYIIVNSFVYFTVTTKIKRYYTACNTTTVIWKITTMTNLKRVINGIIKEATNATTTQNKKTESLETKTPS